MNPTPGKNETCSSRLNLPRQVNLLSVGFLPFQTPISIGGLEQAVVYALGEPSIG